MAETTTPFLKFTKSFKKYTEEFTPAVVDYVRSWARTENLLGFHEDKSLVKVTGTKLQIETLLGTLKERFGYIPPEMREDKKSDDGASEE